jgi:hypothetical protein
MSVSIFEFSPMSSCYVLGNFSLFQGSDFRAVIYTTSIEVKHLIEMFTICQLMWYGDYLIRRYEKKRKACMSSLLKIRQVS